MGWHENFKDDSTFYVSLENINPIEGVGGRRRGQSGW
jgi:hypothetical protein